MKTFLVAFLLVSSAVSMAQVPASPKLVAVHGSSMAENNSGGDRKHMQLKGEIITADKGIDLKRSQAKFMVEGGFMAVAGKDLVLDDANCADGIYTLVATKGNFIAMPDGSEVYYVPQVVGFSCINK